MEVPVFDVPRILPRYKHSQKRLLLVDFEATLWKRDLSQLGLIAMKGDDYKLPEDVLEVLVKVSEDRRNEVWLLSGLSVNLLQRVADRVPKIGIVYV